MPQQNFGQGSHQLGPTGTRILGVIFILIGIPIVYFTYGMYFGSSAAVNWTVLHGTILSKNVSAVYSPGSSGNQFNNYYYTPEVSYSYMLNGTLHYGNNIYASGNNFGYPTGQDAEAVIQNYTIGENVTVYYDPIGNGITALTTKSNGSANILILVFLIGGIMAIFMGILALVFGSR